MLPKLFFVLSLFQTALAQFSPSSLTNVTQAFSQAQIVPDVVASFNPTALVNMSFANPMTMQSLNVTPGALLTMPQTATEPTFFLISNSSTPTANQTFVLAIVDPDAPTPQNRSSSQILHFLGGDFHLTSSTLLTNRSTALANFIRPQPPAGSPPHRYILFVFSQPDNFNTAAPALVNATTPRSNFNLTRFGSAVRLGNPIAGNFFLVARDNATTSSASGTTAIVPVCASTTTFISSAARSATPSTASSALAVTPTFVGVACVFSLVITTLFAEWVF